jgi:type I restriction enzyme S subunit
MNEIKMMRLSDVCRVYQPETIAKKSLPLDGAYPVYGANGKIGFNDKYNHEDPQLLLGCRGSVGSIHISEPRSWINGNAMVVQPFESIVTLDYLRYALLGGIDLKDAVSGTAQPQITRESLSPIQIAVPSLEKQRKIVDKLDNVFAEIDSLDENLELSVQKMDQFLHSMLNAEFESSEPRSNLGETSTVESISKDMVRIGDVCKLMTGGTPSRTRPEYFENGTIKWLVSGDINKVEIFDCDGRITTEAMKSSNTKILPINSVMIALNGQGKTRGTVALLRTEATCNQSLVSISPMNENLLLPEFLFHNLRMRYQEIRRMTGDDGNDRRGLNMILIRDIEIPLPSLQKQRETVEKLDLVFAEIETMRNQIAIKQDFAGMLRRSLLREAFSPKIETISA